MYWSIKDGFSADRAVRVGGCEVIKAVAAESVFAEGSDGLKAYDEANRA